MRLPLIAILLTWVGGACAAQTPDFPGDPEAGWVVVSHRVV
jgi:hypothetical protein